MVYTVHSSTPHTTNPNPLFTLLYRRSQPHAFPPPPLPISNNHFFPNPNQHITALLLVSKSPSLQLLTAVEPGLPHHHLRSPTHRRRVYVLLSPLLLVSSPSLLSQFGCSFVITSVRVIAPVLRLCSAIPVLSSLYLSRRS
ncbi:hypothetical protein PIB30_051239 [Stylosanthes scabra]|uniref:Uncharacterized protein n=1 Tax=Stylosanthes scabra TaxID=79078 RepID=A0ABU6WGD1_9FABA|nr:hypothetical protein [Stylosanthes scabra]